MNYDKNDPTCFQRVLDGESFDNVRWYEWPPDVTTSLTGTEINEWLKTHKLYSSKQEAERAHPDAKITWIEVDDSIKNVTDFDSWCVAEYQDGVCTLLHAENAYEIEEDRLFSETDWLPHLKEKTWFNEAEELSFLRGFYFLRKHILAEKKYE